ncbi:hypothetical protein FOT62_21490 [Serratia marcescens]|uniref:Uncharacterized protein n=1 Tax=Serratia marcescens TaxID=615 RepID=A0A5C7BV37_SERMA|nr:hypothetical protein [Serratia marcescens]TXE28341.1 hypothetical protein FOT62_21490 [Serratia marcescens]TXE56851.1 hypothetical protein FOT56_23565 [Serratia marcescens]
MFSFLMQLPFLSVILWVVLSGEVARVLYFYVRGEFGFGVFLNVIFPAFFLLLFFSFGAFSFLFAKGPVPGTYLTYVMTRSLYLNIKKNAIPEMETYSEKIAFIVDFTQRIVSMDGVYWRTLIIKSHLILPGIRKVMAKTLKECKWVTFTCESRDTPKSEARQLNWFYGRKKNRDQPDNNFKVHKTGSLFVIRRIARRG